MKEKRFVPLEKQSIKEKRLRAAEKRNGWNGVVPVTRVIENGKKQKRCRVKEMTRIAAETDEF